MTGPDLAALARHLGKTGQEMAAALGINERSYRRMVKGKRPIPPGIVAMAEAMAKRRPHG